jgi:peptidoglycan/xylan/chitin deacetylase (PgdA/CDA1 family)
MAARLPILTFHGIDDRRSVTSIKPEVFRRGMATLHECGYRTLDLLEVVDCLERAAPFPDRSVAVTFDDGFQSVYEEAFPVLTDYGMSATVFIAVGQRTSVKTTDRLPRWENRPMLSWGEIREMFRGGIAFGSHTLTHPNLTRLPAERVETEVRDSKAAIEDALGTRVASFAYPYGRFDQKTREIVRKHYTCACSDKLALATPCSDPYGLERVDAYYLRTDRLFSTMLTDLFACYVRIRSVLREFRRAVESNRET